MGAILIFEGIDGSGKSTAIDSTLQRYADKNIKTDFHHNGKFINQAKAHKAYRIQLFNALSFDGITILDRAYIAELLYSKVYNKHEDDIEDYKKLDEAFNRAGANIIWCNPPYEQCHLNWSERLEQEAFTDPIKYIELYKMHQIIPYITKCPVSMYDYTRNQDDKNSH